MAHLLVDAAEPVAAWPALACCISSVRASAGGAGFSGIVLEVDALLCPCLACCIRKANASWPDDFAASPSTCKCECQYGVLSVDMTVRYGYEYDHK